MRKYLSRLPSLKMIAFNRDSYNFHDTDPSEVESYYEARTAFGGSCQGLVEHLLATGQSVTSMEPLERIRIEMWGKPHRGEMTFEVLFYMDAVKQLEWIFVGQLTLHCFRYSKNWVRPAAERDSCWTLLRKNFGGRTDS